MAIIVGTGASVTFGGVAIGLGILSIGISDASRPAIDSTVMATTGERESIEGQLVDLGTMEIEVLMDAEIGNAATDLSEFYAAGGTGTLILTMGTPTAQGADTYTSEAICTGASWNIPLEDRMTATLTFKLHTTSTFLAVSAP